MGEPQVGAHGLGGVDVGQEEAAVALDGSGRIIGMTKGAEHLAPDRSGPLIGRNIGDLLEVSVDDLPDLMRGRPTEDRVLRLKDGRALFGHATAPHAAPVRSRDRPRTNLGALAGIAGKLALCAPLVLAAQPQLPAGADFFAAARNSGDKWSYGSVGIGSVGHLGMEYVKSRAGNFEAVHIPYNGNPAVITAIIGGQVQMALMPPGIAMPQVKAGKMKAIGLTGPRSPIAADTPSLSELGVQMDALEVWVALVGPASLSAAAQERLAREVPAAVNGEARERLLTSGWQAVGSSADVMRQRVARETGILGGIISSRGIKIE